MFNILLVNYFISKICCSEIYSTFISTHFHTGTCQYFCNNFNNLPAKKIDIALRRARFFLRVLFRYQRTVSLLSQSTFAVASFFSSSSNHAVSELSSPVNTVIVRICGSEDAQVPFSSITKANGLYVCSYLLERQKERKIVYFRYILNL